MIGIILADPNELKSIGWKHHTKEKINQFDVYHFDICGESVVMFFSGIGIVNAAAATQQLISTFKPSKIINFGAVGGYGKDLALYDVIIPKKIYFHDVYTPWYKNGQTPGEKEFYENLLHTNETNLASGNSFITNEETIKKISQEFNVSIFDMECAAIFQVAHKNNVPCFTLKVISDIIGKNLETVEAINQRIEKAGKIASNEVIKYISR